MTNSFPLLADYVVTQLKAATFTIGTVDIDRRWKHWLSLKEVGNDIKISVVPWDFDRGDASRGSVFDSMIVSTVVQKAVKWEDIPKMDEMALLAMEVLKELTDIPGATLGTSPNQIQVQRTPAPNPEPFLLPEETTEYGLFTSRIATQFLVQEV